MRRGANDHSQLHGVEYENPVQGHHDHNAPCAVCNVSDRSAVILLQPNTTAQQHGPESTMDT